MRPMTWKKGVVIRAFADSPEFLGGADFLKCADDYSQVFQRARRCGFEGVQPYLELDAGVLNLSSSQALLTELSRRARDEGIELPSIEIAPLQYSFTCDDPAVRHRGVKVVRRAIDIAAALGCRSVLVIPGYVGKMWDPATDQVDYEDAAGRTLDALRELAPHARQAGVDILIEPIWNMFLLSPLEMRGMIDQAGGPPCGVLLDTGNVTLFGFAEQWIRILGPRLKEIHLKDYRRAVGTIAGFVPLLAGDVNWTAVVEAARAGGFEGYWIAEQFPYPRHPAAVLEHTSTAMDFILGRRTA